MNTRWFRLLPASRLARIGMVVGLAVAATFALAQCAAFGAYPSGERLARAESSLQWRAGRFANRQAAWSDTAASYRRLFFGPSQPDASPHESIPVVTPSFAAAPSSGLAVTWFGHSSALLEIDGTSILIDPLWSARASPLGFVGPSRWFRPPIELTALHADAVVISHDHYDHLDMDAIAVLAGTRVVFVVPLGVGAHLERWGVPSGRIIELDWWQSTRVAAIELTATPARHASGRISSKSDRTLWAGFAFSSARHRVWYSGDTGFHSELARIGERLGPFDLTLIEAGQYDANWPDAHLGPELAVEAHRTVRGRVLLPVHWGALQLAPHPWTEPIERVLAAAACRQVEVVTPRPGERIEPTMHPSTARWWPSIAWRLAHDYPVVGTKNGNPDQRVEWSGCGR